MRLYILSEVDRVRGESALTQALKALRDALNDISSRRIAGTAVLVAGVAQISVPGLQAGTVVVPGYVNEAGTPGRLRCSQVEHDIAAGIATIRSSSTSDTSTVAWIAVT